jgi:2-amino-4-hydroxy-6-hydroxymethyldihydropteridine diphosphokinase
LSAWIGLGSNLGDGPAVLRSALKRLQGLPKTRLLRCSSLYRSEPWGDPDQPPFTNAVAELETGLEPTELLTALLEIESQMGRVRGDRRWGPRLIDLDLLLFDDRVMDLPELTLPHPLMHQRAFVLVPLAELDDGLLVPGKAGVRDLVDALDVSTVSKLAQADEETWWRC